MTAPVPQPGILDIAPYVGGKSSAKGAQKIVKLSSNESAKATPAAYCPNPSLNQIVSSTGANSHSNGK